MAHALDGTRIPEACFHLLVDGRLTELPAWQLFGGQTVVLFALPGAYTPTCSNRHVPRFQELAPALKAAGVDEIVCLSVNDPWVMAAWAHEEHAPAIRFIPDTEGRFTEALGMLVDKPGLGRRSRRYAMIVRDGVIETTFCEPDEGDDPYTVSDADTVLRHLDPDAPPLTPTAVFARPGCPFCARALRLLDEQDIACEVIEVGGALSMQAVLAVSGRATVPQIFIGGRHIGGLTDLEAYLQARQSGDTA